MAKKLHLLLALLLLTFYVKAQTLPVTGGTSAAFTLTMPATPNLVQGITVKFKATNASAAAATINVNGTGVLNMKTPAGANVAAGDIASGQVVELVYDGTAWQVTSPLASSLSGSSAWGTTGNTGTVDGTNFIGTTDNVPLNFKVNNQKVGRIEGLTGGSVFMGYLAGDVNTSGGNIGIGQQALSLNTTGYQNTSVGMQALYVNTTGYQNLAVGAFSLSNNSLGSNNTSTGRATMMNNTIGNDNTAFGYFALSSNVAGNNATAIGSGAMYFANNTSTPFTNYNVAVGFEALRGSATASANTGNYNTAIGYQTLWSNTTGNSNTANGRAALYTNSTGYNNSAYGASSLYFNTTGFWNTAIGYSALINNTTGARNTSIGNGSSSSNSTGNDNTAVGSEALEFNTSDNNSAFGSYAAYSNTSGNQNTAVGKQALYLNQTGVNNTSVGYFSLLNTTGNYNTALGHQSLFNNTGGASNTGVGTSALSTNTTGNNNTAIGQGADVTSGALSKATAIGYNAKVASSNALVLGGTGADAVNVGIGNTSPAASLDVTGQMYSRSYTSAAGSSVNWNDGNNQVLQSVGGSAITFANMLDGGDYNLIITDATARTYTFSQAGLTFYFAPTNASTSPAQSTIYHFNRIGSSVFIDWKIVGMPGVTGESTTASNGLTLSGADVQLGGSLASNTTITQNGFSLTSTYTGTATTGQTYNANSITTASAEAITGNGITTGNVLALSSTSTLGNASKVLNITRSGANSTATKTNYGSYITISNTGATSTNIAGYFQATGATNNYALQLGGSTSGTLNISPAATTTSYSLTMPSAQGAASTVLTNNGAGILSWAAASGTPAGANTQLQFNNSGVFGANSELLWDNTNKRLSVGPATSGFTGMQFNIAGDLTSYPAGISISGFGSPFSPLLMFNYGGGTAAAPTNVGNGKSIGGLQFNGYEGGFVNTGASLGAYSTQTWTASAHGAAMSFVTTTNNTTGPTERMVIDHNGNVGIGVSSPTSLFTVGSSNEFQINSTGNIIKINNVTTSFPSSQGAVNSVLTNNGSGTLTWVTPTAASLGGWGTTGNTGTTAGTNFIGTTDNIDLVFKRNGISSGIIANTNTAFGNVALANLSTGTSNVAIGSNALQNMNTASGNTAVGSSALSSNVVGNANTAIGQNALNLATGAANTAVGALAMSSTTTGDNNVAVGFWAMRYNTLGTYNAAFGNYSLQNNTTANQNTALGYGTLYTQSFNNSGVAWSTDNVAIGSNALYNNQPTSNVNAMSNTAIGAQSLYSNTTGTNNTAVGKYSGYSGSPNTTGSNNTFIGYGSGLATATQRTNATAIGYNARVDASNALILGGTGADAVSVGIGTTAPAVRFHVADNTPSVYAAIIAQSSATTASGLLVRTVTTGSSTTPIFSANHNTSTSAFNVWTDGKTSVGTQASANTTLDVKGDFSIRQSPSVTMAGTMDFTGYSVVELTGAITTITTLLGGTDGKIVILYHQTAVGGTIMSNAGNIIIGSAATITSNATAGFAVTLVYNSASAKWIVISTNL